MSNKNFDDIRVILNDPTKMKDVWELACEMDAAGTSIFSDKDEAYIRDFITLVQASSLTYLISMEQLSPETALVISRNGVINLYVSLCIKEALGLAILEELR